jgi:hypothetical protein
MERNFKPELLRRKGLNKPIKHRYWFQKSYHYNYLPRIFHYELFFYPPLNRVEVNWIIQEIITIPFQVF